MSSVVPTEHFFAPAGASFAAVGEAGSADPITVVLDSTGGSATSAVPLESLRGIAFLDRLETLTRTDAIAAIARNPQTVAAFAANPPAAAAVAEWWRTAPLRTRGAVITAAPELVGNLDGVPITTRDIANRGVLEATNRRIRDRLNAGPGRAERSSLIAQTHMLEQIAQALASHDGYVRQLVALETEGEGRAVVAVGDVGTADYVSYLIPGMFFGVDAQIVAWTEAAATLVREQASMLQRVNPDNPGTVAAIAWIGYRTPSLVNVASMELAREGRDALTASLAGLRAARGDDQPYLSIVGHSYGSTAALLSLEEDDVWVDALALVGSPGSTARTVDELHVVDGNVWVGAADWDPILASGVFGSQPLSPSYGAKRFSVAPGIDSLTGAALVGALSHNDYFSLGGSSLRNLSLIAIDAEEFVTAADRSAGDASAKYAKRLHRTI